MSRQTDDRFDFSWTQKQKKREVCKNQIWCPKTQKTQQISRQTDDRFDFSGTPYSPRNDTPPPARLDHWESSVVGTLEKNIVAHARPTTEKRGQQKVSYVGAYHNNTCSIKRWRDGCETRGGTSAAQHAPPSHPSSRPAGRSSAASAVSPRSGTTIAHRDHCARTATTTTSVAAIPMTTTTNTEGGGAQNPSCP